MENKWKDHTKMITNIHKAILDYHSFCKKNFSFLKTEAIAENIEEITKSYLKHIAEMENLAKL